ncbi:MAG: HEAT repeat domain-containing protein, partial [Pseudomonadota bacterium]
MQASSPEDQRPSHALSPWLESQNEVLRCAAIRATSGLCEDVDMQRETLLTALMDPDPDVRTDAMEAFAPLARDGDAGTLLLSLSGDPVREVKLAAIAGLGGLQCPEASGLLRSLARSRAEDQVAWEDEDSDWEDWLDIQIAAIKALGQMGDASAIPDLLAARDDEYGQTLDVQVFEALSLMGA